MTRARWSVAEERHPDGRREEWCGGVEQCGEPGRQGHGRDRDERERERREERTDDEEARHASADDRQRAPTGERDQDGRADQETDVGRPDRPDLRSSDAHEQEDRTPHGPEIQQGA